MRRTLLIAATMLLSISPAIAQNAPANAGAATKVEAIRAQQRASKARNLEEKRVASEARERRVAKANAYHAQQGVQKAAKKQKAAAYRDARQKKIEANRAANSTSPH
ncbi:hypothetical protein U1701_13070 [Sphingomonas sp. PB2P19]|uniref:hypothetical protein n=1 Tax=Sphingomonas rhamnosi TaxID=3096156 RepID=UPI002FCA7BB0